MSTLNCSLPILGRSLRIIDQRTQGAHDGATMAANADERAAAFGARYRVPMSVSGRDLVGDDKEAWRTVETLYREAVKLVNRYEAAALTVDEGNGGRGCPLPVGIVLADFGASLVAADALRFEYY